MGTIHSFNIELAAEIGIAPAIVFHYMRYWIYLNIINNKNFVEGRHWTYNTMSAIQKHFPYMSLNTITRAVSKLIEKGFLLDGCYNKDPYDKTKWYTLSDMAMSRFPFADFAKMQNAVTQNELTDSPKMGEPIPIITNYNKESINNNINIITNTKESAEKQQSQPALKEETKPDFFAIFNEQALKMKDNENLRMSLAYLKIKDFTALTDAFRKLIIDRMQQDDFIKNGYVRNCQWLKRVVPRLDLSAATGVKLGVGEMINEKGERYYINPWKNKAIIVPDDAPPRPSDKHIWSKSGGNWITTF